LGSDFDDKASDNPDIPLGDNCSMNNTSDINDCISIDSDYEGVSSLSNSSVYNNVNSNDNLLRIVCLNCCGIKTRLQYPEFRNLLQSYDIVCFVETKTDDIDIITLPGYKFVMKNREKITKNRSGGIMAGFKDNLAKHIDIVNTDSKYVMWFKCSEQLFKTDQEYLSFANKSKYICLLGDFSARTATDTDFVDLIKNRHVDDYITDFVDNFTNILNDLKMPLNRIIIVTFLQRKQYIYS
jgi:exonuclease III